MAFDPLPHMSSYCGWAQRWQLQLPGKARKRPQRRGALGCGCGPQSFLQRRGQRPRADKHLGWVRPRLWIASCSPTCCKRAVRREAQHTAWRPSCVLPWDTHLPPHRLPGPCSQGTESGETSRSPRAPQGSHPCLTLGEPSTLRAPTSRGRKGAAPHGAFSSPRSSQEHAHQEGRRREGEAPQAPPPTPGWALAPPLTPSVSPLQTPTNSTKNSAAATSPKGTLPPATLVLGPQPLPGPGTLACGSHCQKAWVAVGPSFSRSDRGHGPPVPAAP